MTRLLLVNPNTTVTITETVLAEARRAAAAGTEIQAVTGAFGATIVSTEAENVIAGHAALDLLAANYAGFDAAVLAISFDTGVFAARTLLPIPVVGITESALLAACLLGRRIGLVMFGAQSLPLYQDLIDRVGVATRVGAMETIELGSTASYLETTEMDRGVEAAALRLATRGVDVIVVCGAATAGIADRIKACLPLPILDGVAAAVAQAQSLVALAPTLGNRARRLAAGEPLKNLGSHLTALLDGA